MADRKGRGQLNSIELLPEEVQHHVVWVRDELNKRERLQKDILGEFNARLADHGVAPVSKSAFNRHSVRLAGVARRLHDTRIVTDTVVKRMGPGEADELTIMVAEFIKTLVFEMLEANDHTEFSPKQAKEMAEALRAATNAQHVSAKRRREVNEEIEAAVTQVTENVGKQAGLDADKIAQLRRDFLGVKEKQDNKDGE